MLDTLLAVIKMNDNLIFTAQFDTIGSVSIEIEFTIFFYEIKSFLRAYGYKLISYF